MNHLMNSWYALLNGNITYSSKEVQVFIEEAPEDIGASPTISEHYILLRREGETAQNDKRFFNDAAVVIVDIVTVFNQVINPSVADEIDAQIQSELFDNVRSHNLGSQSGIQILNVVRENSVYLPEGDQTKRYYRKVSRYNHRINTTT